MKQLAGLLQLSPKDTDSMLLERYTSARGLPASHLNAAPTIAQLGTHILCDGPGGVEAACGEGNSSVAPPCLFPPLSKSPFAVAGDLSSVTEFFRKYKGPRSHAFLRKIHRRVNPPTELGYMCATFGDLKGYLLPLIAENEDVRQTA